MLELTASQAFKGLRSCSTDEATPLVGTPVDDDKVR